MIELIVAAVVLSIGLIGFLAVIGVLFPMSKTSRNFEVATNSAAGKMEEIKAWASESDNFATLETSVYADQDFRVPGLNPQLQDTDGFPGEVTITVENADLKEIQVKVDWREGEVRQSTTLKTLITDKG